MNDAADVAQVLQDAGFSVTLKLNADQQTMEEAIRNFGVRLQRGGVGLFYYAGHGVQVKGCNYLIPIGAPIKHETDVRYKAVHVGQVLDEMGYANNGFNIVFLDACRNNTLTRTFRSAGRGLARVEGPRGTFIVYATEPGAVAEDGSGRNSPFTKHLLRAIQAPSLSLEQVFKKVLQGVSGETRGQQTPWLSSSFTGDFYFRREPVRQPLPVPASERSGKAEDRARTDYELAYWQSSDRCGTVVCYNAYLERYASGHFASLTKQRIKALAPPEPMPAPVSVADRRDSQLATCAAHLKANRLTRGTGGNAADCYAAVLQQDSGNELALQGLVEIENRYARWAEKALREGRLEAAKTYLARLEQFNPETVAVQTLTEKLREAALTPSLIQREPSVSGPSSEGVGAISIAVVPFGWLGEGASAPQNVSDIIASDLRRSGRFVPLADRDLVSQPTETAQIEFSDWRHTDNLVIGDIAETGSGEYTVRFRLFDVLRAKQIAGYSMPAKSNQIRYTAHTISDIIYEKLTGQECNFVDHIVHTDQFGSNKHMFRLILTDSDGYNPRILLSSPGALMSPVFSADERKIAYVSFENKVAEVYIQEIHTGDRQIVEKSPVLNRAGIISAAEVADMDFGGKVAKGPCTQAD